MRIIDGLTTIEKVIAVSALISPTVGTYFFDRPIEEALRLTLLLTLAVAVVVANTRNGQVTTPVAFARFAVIGLVGSVLFSTLLGQTGVLDTLRATPRSEHGRGPLSTGWAILSAYYAFYGAAAFWLLKQCAREAAERAEDRLPYLDVIALGFIAYRWNTHRNSVRHAARPMRAHASGSRARVPRSKARSSGRRGGRCGSSGARIVGRRRR